VLIPRPGSMAAPGRSFRQLRRFHHVINSDKVFGTHTEEDNQLREMVEAGKTITIISLRLKRTVTAVRGRLGILKVSLHKVGRRRKENPPA
jgi:hypothetical protein